MLWVSGILFFGMAFMQGSAVAATAPELYVGKFQHYWGPALNNKKGDDVISIDVKNGKISVVYDGVDPEREHGVLYFQSTIEKIEFLNDGSIRFAMPFRELFGSSKHIGKKGKKPAGLSRPDILMTGRIIQDGIKFTCESRSFDCLENEMIFKKIK